MPKVWTIHVCQLCGLNWQAPFGETTSGRDTCECNYPFDEIEVVPKEDFDHLHLAMGMWEEE